jgi:hypothetical protein
MKSENTIRQVARVVRAEATSDGAGVRLNRVIANRQVSQIDPFLLLDAFESDNPDDYIGGFPMHPHRGFETVTYMIAGKMHHRDSLGNAGTIGPGDVQWMTAGHGIIHEEMPAQDKGRMFGFQLWVNLPRRLKMTPPRYQNISKEEIPEISSVGGAAVRAIAGTVDGVTGPVAGIPTAPLYLDVTLPPHSAHRQSVTRGHSAAAFVFEGSGELGGADGVEGRRVSRNELAIFSDGDRVIARSGEDPLRFLLIAGRPLNEPVARGGPFVMNTREEIEQAFEDYRNGTLAGGG